MDLRSPGLEKDASESICKKSPVGEDLEPLTDERTHHHPLTWSPGFIEQLPWIGASGFLCVLVALAGQVAILCTSHGKLVSDWPTKKYSLAPNVLLNLVNSLSTLGLITAIGQGLAIAWWRKALQGATLKSLHRDHGYSWSFYNVLTSGRHFNKLALAALMAKLTIIDSTLFQQATKTTLGFKIDYMNTTIEAWIGNQWPEGVGGIPGTDGETRTVNRNFTDIIDAYNSKIGNGKVHDTETLFKNCPMGQTCSGTVDALGFAFDCSTQIENIDYGSWRLQNLSAPPSANISYPLWDIKFRTIWPGESHPYTSINLTMLYVNSTEGPSRSCPGTRTKRNCEIRPALVRYPLTVLSSDKRQSVNVTHVGFTKSIVQHYPFNADLGRNNSQIDGIQVLRRFNLTEMPTNISTVGAIAFSLNNLFKSSANLTYSVDWDLTVKGPNAQTEFSADSTAHIADFCNYNLDQDYRGYSDPFIELLRQINNFGFISSLYLSGAPFVDVNERLAAGYPLTTLNCIVNGHVELYETSFPFLSGAVIVTLFTIACVLPVYWRYWDLGRKVTLGPFEIANALNAPVFENAANRNGDVDELLNEVGMKKLQYGQLLNAPGQLRMSSPDQVAKPTPSTDKPYLEKKSVGSFAALLGAVATAITFGKAPS